MRLLTAFGLILTTTALLAAATASAAGADASFDVLEATDGCYASEDQGGSYNEHEDGYSSYRYANAYGGCRAENTLASAAVSDEEGRVAGAHAGSRSSSGGSSSESHWSSASDRRCEQWYNFTWCTYDSYSSSSSARSDAYRYDWTGARAETRNGSAAAAVTECSEWQSSSSEEWSYRRVDDNGNRSGGYDASGSRHEHASCFTGARAFQGVSGTGTGLDGAGASAEGGRTASSGTSCTYTDEAGETCTSHEWRAVGTSLGLFVPGVGSFHASHAFAPANPSLLP